MAAILIATVIISGGDRVEWVGAAAVWVSTRHMSVADRLREKEDARSTTEVDCYRWLDRYLIGKEVLWVVYFVWLGAWSALVGSGIFLAYPYWRKAYRKYCSPGDAP